MPTPATATPTGRSQIAPRRSDNRPKSGWITDDETAEASMRVAARVYESPKRSTRNGRSAGSAPFAKSVPRCPAPRSAIARLSMPARTSASVAAGASGGAFEHRLGFASGPDAQRGDRRRRHGDHLHGGEAHENRVGARRAQDRPADGQPERAREDEDGPHRRQRARPDRGGRPQGQDGVDRRVHEAVEEPGEEDRGLDHRGGRVEDEDPERQGLAVDERPDQEEPVEAVLEPERRDVPEHRADAEGGEDPPRDLRVGAELRDHEDRDGREEGDPGGVTRHERDAPGAEEPVARNPAQAVEEAAALLDGGRRHRPDEAAHEPERDDVRRGVDDD